MKAPTQQVFNGKTLVHSLASLPSSKHNTSSANRRMSGSWVETMIVLPCVFSSWKVWIILSAFFWSKFPVGSSARIKGGSLAKALAMATRCCSPPLSCEGKWVSLCCKPTVSSSISTRSWISWDGFLSHSMGNATFSATVNVETKIVGLEDKADLGAAEIRQKILILIG